jgi:hypothetical protein
MPPVVFGPAARAEMIEASNWYAAQSLALASRFIAEVNLDHPELSLIPVSQAKGALQSVVSRRCRPGAR